VEIPDKTPYGCAEAFGVRAFRATCWWVCSASAERLAHLALMPRSSASRRFVFWMGWAIATAAALVPFGWVGWHVITNAPRDENSAALLPAGRGWYHVAGGDHAAPYRGRAVPTEVWWNPTLTIVTAASVFVAAVLVVWLILVCQRAGVRRSLGPRYGDQGRLEAALHYNAAWLGLLLPAALGVALRPLAEISVAAQWSVVIPPVAFYAPPLVLGLIAVIGYIFGLIRAAATVPMGVRTGAVLFFAFWNPLLISAWVAAAGVGLYFWIQLLIPQLQVHW
jgi:hypothetical protein